MRLVFLVAYFFLGVSGCELRVASYWLRVIITGAPTAGESGRSGAAGEATRLQGVRWDGARHVRIDPSRDRASRGTLPAHPLARKEFSRVHDPLGIEGALEAAHHVELNGLLVMR